MEPLAEYLVNKKDDRGQYFCRIILLNEGHRPQITKLQTQVVASLSGRDSFFPLTPEELQYILKETGGMGIGALVGQKLVGFRCLYFPGDRGDNLGQDVDLPGTALNQVVHLEATFIHPDFQGNSLQKRLTGLVLARLHLLPWPRYLMATVMPSNIPSLIDKFAQGLRIVALKEKYGVGWRYIFFRDLGAKGIAMPESEATIAVDIMDIEQQCFLLEAGYQGVNFGKTIGRPVIIYQRF